MENVYLFRVVQNRYFDYPKIRGMPTIEISIPENYSLSELADIILEAFGFTRDHLIGFYDNWKSYTNSNEIYEERDFDFFPNNSKGLKAKIKKVFNEPNKRMLMIFDYGDMWHFLIDFKGIKKVSTVENKQIVVSRKGNPFSQYSDYDEGYED
ncbi:plasmid pRiA4b ORF-3 family protein [Deferribacterales bacterium Es71-Z0220]|jgi:hypothetical protein|uniref:plasmid pRiA4b ORF-3 family protein n=1 Tax=Deferrivibrio essentukiensis TaxID=2880922 RepID=UPI001F6015A3|nr:plasmid pRiA4b ORF-3 family protein [Deferrivibrio essentukiensis]MBZ4642851.1 hypothetical protein [Deferribacteraceae bacterium]MCB4204850.1 plasmid pRiA4b ORF-3 family protein [Deferrivibrio essentukiensis]MDK2792214.1 hypothetical protein [Deferribacteres bacterium]